MTSSSRVLLVDASPEAQHSLNRALGADLQIQCVPSVKQALEASKTGFDLILLETHLPDGDGVSLVSELRSRDSAVPIVVYSSDTSVSVKVRSFSAGADDYVVKTVDPDELKARVSARIERSRDRAGREETLKKGDLQVNLTTQKAAIERGDGLQVIDLTPAEFRLLHYFMRHEGQLFTREQLLKAVWKDRTDVLDRTVDKHISSLRQKLGQRSECIATVSGSGYRFIPPGN